MLFEKYNLESVRERIVRRTNSSHKPILTLFVRVKNISYFLITEKNLCKNLHFNAIKVITLLKIKFQINIFYFKRKNKKTHEK